MESPDAKELRRQINDLEKENKSIKHMSTSIDDLAELMDTNNSARKRLRKKLLDAGYKM